MEVRFYLLFYRFSFSGKEKGVEKERIGTEAQGKEEKGREKKASMG